jgi:4-amino-4-deoxy-L-arabinose transferase-like glycosyltransferase
MALVAVLGVTGFFWLRTEVEDFSEFDQPFYLGIAYDLVHTGHFTDGFMFAQPGPGGTRPVGMRFAPLYPAVVAGAAEFDTSLRSGMDCLVESGGKLPGCDKHAASLRCLQFFELSIFFWLIWWMANAAGGASLGWLSLIVSFGAAPLLLRSVNYIMTEMTCLLLVTVAMTTAVQALRKTERRLLWCAATGVALGLSALTRPAFLYLIPASAVGAIALGRWRGLQPLSVMVGAAAVVVSPWILRNDVVLGRASVTYGYDSHTLVQRIAFDTMSWREYGLSFVCWLPDGNEIGRAVAGVGACDRFGWDEHANSFYVLGLRHMLYETLASSGGYEHHLRFLFHEYILRMPLKHFLVSIPLALRGAYVAHWWGFVLLIACGAWTIRALRHFRTGDPDFDPNIYLLMALPAFFMLAFNAVVAVNQVRYNLMLVPAYSIAGGLTLRRLAGVQGWWLNIRRPVGRVR